MERGRGEVIMKRRIFVKNTGLLAATSMINFDLLARAAGLPPLGEPKGANKLPEWRGFNLTDFNTPFPRADRKYTTEEHLKWMSDWGFDFVRFPVSYPYYLDFDRTKKITPEEVYKIDEASVNKIEQLV